MSVYEDSGWYEAAGKLEPQLGTTKGLSTELVITRGEEARKRLQELAAHDLLFNEFHFELFDPCYSQQDSIVKFAIRHHELMEKHKEPTFPRSSQNQTVASGVEGAHEGTTADENTYDESTDFCAKLMATSLAPTRTPQLRDSRDPEKLNNVDEAGLFVGTPHRSALAESSLSSPPPELNMTRADDGRPQFLWFGGKYYTIEHPECMEALLKAIREFPTVSPIPTEPGAESTHSGKPNTADESATQLPKEDF